MSTPVPLLSSSEWVVAEVAFSDEREDETEMEFRMRGEK